MLIRILRAWFIYLLILLIQVSDCTAVDDTVTIAQQRSSNRTFKIDYLNDRFLLDGREFRYMSGSLHYTRVHHLHWEDRLMKMQAAGLDAVATYVQWSVHEVEPGVYNFKGQNDLVQFIKLAQKHKLYVILRAGPYACAEWDYGGFPGWFLSDNQTMVVRTMDKKYMGAVQRWLAVLLPLVKPYLYHNGGPILMVQVENEYGSYFACDHVYMKTLADIFAGHLGNETVLFTTDGNGQGYLKCGTTPRAYATVDFGVTDDVKQAFAPMREFNKQGPLVNSELYTGWLDFWGKPHNYGSTKALISTLDQIVALNASVNMYMFEGGTTFGFMNGALIPYSSMITSYDYDAPLSEAGDVTDKFMAVRGLISKYKPNLPPVPKNTSKKAYGSVQMYRLGTIAELLDVLTPSNRIVQSLGPLNMEQLRHYYGFTLYRHTFKKGYPPSFLNISGVRDRGHVMLNQQPIGVVDRAMQTSLILSVEAGQTLDIIVENMGRINYGSAINDNRKGIVSNVILGADVLTNWKIYPIMLESLFNDVVSTSVEADTDESENLVEFSQKSRELVDQRLLFQSHKQLQQLDEQQGEQQDEQQQNEQKNEQEQEERYLKLLEAMKQKQNEIPLKYRQHLQQQQRQQQQQLQQQQQQQQQQEEQLLNEPTIYSGFFSIPADNKDLHDTFINMCSWKWGVVYINGNNLGRYRPTMGPQTTLYVPKYFLNNSTNHIIVLEMDGRSKGSVGGAKLDLIDKPQLDSTCF